MAICNHGNKLLCNLIVHDKTLRGQARGPPPASPKSDELTVECALQALFVVFGGGTRRAVGAGSRGEMGVGVLYSSFMARTSIHRLDDFLHMDSSETRRMCQHPNFQGGKRSADLSAQR